VISFAMPAAHTDGLERIVAMLNNILLRWIFLPLTLLFTSSYDEHAIHCEIMSIPTYFADFLW